MDLPGGKWGGGFSSWKTSIFSRLILPNQTAHFIRDDSHAARSRDKVKALLGENQLDVLFIDGDHSFEGVKQDFVNYSPFVRPDGLIVFHDIASHPPAKDVHVEEFWAEVKAQYPFQEIIEDVNQGWAGIGILRNRAARSAAF